MRFIINSTKVKALCENRNFWHPIWWTPDIQNGVKVVIIQRNGSMAVSLDEHGVGLAVAQHVRCHVPYRGIRYTRILANIIHGIQMLTYTWSAGVSKFSMACIPIPSRPVLLKLEPQIQDYWDHNRVANEKQQKKRLQDTQILSLRHMLNYAATVTALT